MATTTPLSARRAGGPPRRPRVALYGHDTQGLGHLRRNLALAEVLADEEHGLGADVLVLSGASEAGLFPRPQGVDVLVLPGVRKDGDGRYAPRALRGDLGDVVDLRRATLATALRSFTPDLFVVDKAPWGFGGELADALPLLRAAGTHTVLGLRDVLDDPGSTRSQWASEEGDEAVRRCYDEVWVYGDRSVHDLPEAAGMAPDVVARCRHVGYLSEGRLSREAARARPPVEGNRWVLGVAGGGQDGAPLARAVAASVPPPGTTLVLVAGPQLPEADLKQLRAAGAARGDLHVVRFSKHCAAWAAGAEAVVAMGGANTVGELLATDVPALVVPRTHPRREQEVRARALEARGALDVMLPDEVSAARVTAWLRGAVGRRTDRSSLQLDGLSTVRRRADQLVGATRRSPARPAAAPSRPASTRPATTRPASTSAATGTDDDTDAWEGHRAAV
ncbi:glycosyltransferase family protein [Pseudokineococcus sp. 1T1Z-3]|uniref:glycosyltransferase family protein n=1 Tax=Pseudokineococcus sp. 1T1Z-3 TaxID=3132745 RepID=UPI003096E816